MSETSDLPPSKRFRGRCVTCDALAFPTADDAQRDFARRCGESFTFTIVRCGCGWFVLGDFKRKDAPAGDEGEAGA